MLNSKQKLELVNYGPKAMLRTVKTAKEVLVKFFYEEMDRWLEEPCPKMATHLF